MTTMTMDNGQQGGQWENNKYYGHQKGQHTRTEDNNEDNRQWTTRRMMDVNYDNVLQQGGWRTTTRMTRTTNDDV